MKFFLNMINVITVIAGIGLLIMAIYYASQHKNSRMNATKIDIIVLFFSIFGMLLIFTPWYIEDIKIINNLGNVVVHEYFSTREAHRHAADVARAWAALKFDIFYYFILSTGMGMWVAFGLMMMSKSGIYGKITFETKLFFVCIFMTVLVFIFGIVRLPFIYILTLIG